VLSCDGYGSRDILRALIFAVQYEAGLSDSSANGNFGPATQGVRRTGSTGPWVQLFSTAMTLSPRWTGSLRRSTRRWPRR
jgi:hypothetical protein